MAAIAIAPGRRPGPSLTADLGPGLRRDTRWFGLSIPTWRVRMPDRAVIFEAVLWRSGAGREGQARAALEISDAGVAPPLRLVLLDGEKLGDFLVTEGVDARRERELFPDDSAG